MRERRVDLELRERNAALDMLEAAPETRNFYRDLVKLFNEHELAFPHWLGRVFKGEKFADLAFRSANGEKERQLIPEEILRDLMGRLEAEVDRGAPEDAPLLCRGTLLSREQYLSDVHEQGYIDARVEPHGKLTETDVDQWTAAIDR